MSIVKTIEIKTFARRVERLCDYLLVKQNGEIGRADLDDLKVIEDLKNDAADIQFNRVHMVSENFRGLSDYMKGTK